ncbi:uncharacterized protein LOC119093536 [Pollicipes pollicipes]|uniref:uncharacterized protein LOC119093536 n=1 Tax=Pollicipes pollicipes TaxID=41117 RepID=UPI0018854C55|nr:uncharacterized protein LOC119093536 [Pollicipes pollicipes]
MVYDSINQGRRVDVLWPDDRWRQHGGKNHWGSWLPDGRQGTVVHFWCPSHPDRRYRSHVDRTTPRPTHPTCRPHLTCPAAPPGRTSHVDRTILLLEMNGGNYVPVAEAGCQPVDDALTEPERVVDV